MKLLVISDIHGNNHSFKSFLNIQSRYKNDYELLFLGDFIGYYYGPDEIIDFFREGNITCLLGNHDKYFLDILDGKLSLDDCVKKYGRSYEMALDQISTENVKFLRQLNYNKTLTHANKKVYTCHGSPIDNLEGRIYPDTDLSVFEAAVKNFDYVITGHTHHKMNRTFGSTVFLNPGSLGQQRDGKGCSYMLLDLQKDSYSFHTVDYSIASLEEEIDHFDRGKGELKNVLRRRRYY